MSAKQDRQGVRTARDLEQKYRFGQSFNDAKNSIRLANQTASQAESAAQKAGEDVVKLSDSISLAVKNGESTAQITLKVGGREIVQTIDMTGLETYSVIKEYVDAADAVIKGYVDTTASQTKAYADTGDDAVKAYAKTIFSNDNLLDNWYFGNPVNQRGATEYTSTGFCIDRWSFEQWSTISPKVQIRSGCVSVVCGCTDSTDTNTTKIRQTIADPANLAGKTVTFSAKLKNVSVNGMPRLTIYYDGSKKDLTITSAHANRIISVTATLPTSLSSMYVAIGNDANSAGKGGFDIEIESVKLELGSVSTLANDAPPRFSEQLLECQRYYIRFASDGGQWLMGASNGSTLYAPLRLPVPLRAFPDTANNGFKYANVNIYPYVSGGKVEITSLTLAGASGTQDYMLYANHASNALAAKQPGAIRFTAGGYVELSCEI